MVDVRDIFIKDDEIIIRKIRARVIIAYWTTLYSDDFAKDLTKGTYIGTKYISELFLSKEEIEALETKTKKRFNKHYK